MRPHPQLHLPNTGLFRFDWQAPGFEDAPELEPVQVLPEQFHADPTWSGEQRLMAAVLADAIRRYRKGSQEAERWLTAPPSEHLFSFSTICEVLRLNGTRIRDRLAAERKRRP